MRRDGRSTVMRAGSFPDERYGPAPWNQGEKPERQRMWPAGCPTLGNSKNDRQRRGGGAGRTRGVTRPHARDALTPAPRGG